MSSFERIAQSTTDGIRTITLNRPEKRNALDEQTIVELRGAFAAAVGSTAERVVTDVACDVLIVPAPSEPAAAIAQR